MVQAICCKNFECFKNMNLFLTLINFLCLLSLPSFLHTQTCGLLCRPSLVPLVSTDSASLSASSHSDCHTEPHPLAHWFLPPVWSPGLSLTADLIQRCWTDWTSTKYADSPAENTSMLWFGCWCLTNISKSGQAPKQNKPSLSSTSEIETQKSDLNSISSCVKNKCA